MTKRHRHFMNRAYCNVIVYVTIRRYRELGRGSPLHADSPRIICQSGLSEHFIILKRKYRSLRTIYCSGQYAGNYSNSLYNLKHSKIHLIHVSVIFGYRDITVCWFLYLLGGHFENFKFHEVMVLVNSLSYKILKQAFNSCFCHNLLQRSNSLLIFTPLGGHLDDFHTSWWPSWIA